MVAQGRSVERDDRCACHTRQGAGCSAEGGVALGVRRGRNLDTDESIKKERRKVKRRVKKEKRSEGSGGYIHVSFLSPAAFCKKLKGVGRRLVRQRMESH